MDKRMEGTKSQLQKKSQTVDSRIIPRYSESAEDSRKGILAHTNTLDKRKMKTINQGNSINIILLDYDTGNKSLDYTQPRMKIMGRLGSLLF